MSAPTERVSITPTGREGGVSIPVQRGRRGSINRRGGAGGSINWEEEGLHASINREEGVSMTVSIGGGEVSMPVPRGGRRQYQQGKEKGQYQQGGGGSTNRGREAGLHDRGVTMPVPTGRRGGGLHASINRGGWEVSMLVPTGGEGGFHAPPPCWY